MMNEYMIKKKIKVIYISLFLLTFLLYFITLATNVTFEDSGELITAGYTLSIPHPPGYPLFVLIAKIFSFIPIGNIEFRINLLSALFASLAISIMFITLYNTAKKLKLEHPEILSSYTVTLFAISTTVWNIATVTEVYALNLFLFAVQLYLLMKLVESSKKKYFNLFIYISGIALTVHQTSIFMLLIFGALFVIKKWYKLFSIKDYIIFVFLFLLGFSVYLYLPIRANPLLPLNWGNPSNIKNLISVILRKQYGTLPGINLSLHDILFQLRAVNPIYEVYFKSNDLFLFTPINIILLVGFLFLFYKGIKRVNERYIIFILSSIILLYTLILIILTETPIGKIFTLKVFIIPAWIGFYFFVTIGLFSLIRKVHFLWLLIFILIVLNFMPHNNREYKYTSDYAKNIFKNADYGAIIFTIKDNETFPLWDLIYVKNKRPDLIIINTVILSEQWYLTQIFKKYRDLNIDVPTFRGEYPRIKIRRLFIDSIIRSNPERKVYFTSHNFEKFVHLDYNFKSAGILYTLENEATTDEIDNLYYLYFNNIEDDFENYLKYFDNFNLEQFKSEIGFFDTQTRLVFQNCANALFKMGSMNMKLYLNKFSAYLNYIIGVELNNIYNYTVAGNYYLSMGNKAGFRYYYEKAIKLQPNSEYARELIKKLQNKLTGPLEQLKYKAEEYYKRGDFNNALKYYKEALKLNPSSPVLLSNIGDVYFNFRNYAMAIEYYKKSIETDKNYITPYYNLGGCYLTIGDKEKAVQIWRDGLKISPSNNLLRNALERWGK